MSKAALPDTFGEFAYPDVTGHTDRQWDKRMPLDAVAPETALKRSVSVHDAVRSRYRTGDHPTPDDVRLYCDRSDGELWGAVFIVQNLPHAIARTVYRIETIHDGSLRAYSWARLDELGVSE